MRYKKNYLEIHATYWYGEVDWNYALLTIFRSRVDREDKSTTIWKSIGESGYDIKRGSRPP